ncbi:MAG: Ig-like domain-containing protein, partial [Pseudomonadota bacterium]
DSFSYTLSDGTDTDTATVTLTVTAAPPPPPPPGDDDPILTAGPYVLNGAAGSAPVLPHAAGYEVAEGTLAFTFTADDVDGREFLFSKDSGGYDTGGHAGVYIQDGKIVARFQDLTTTYVAETAALVTVGAQTHVAVTFGAAGLSIYVNGVEAASDSYTGGLTGNQEPIVLGANQWASGDLVANKLRDGFDGTLETFELYDVALDDTAIAALSADALGGGGGDPVNTAPVAAADAFVTDEDSPVAGSVTANDTDADGDPLTVTLGQDVTNGSLTLNANGSFTYTPTTGFTGTDSFTYTLSDGTDTDTATVTLTVQPDTPAPVGAPFSDDFADPALDGGWQFAGIAGGAQLGSDSTDAYLEITSPAGVPVSASDFLTTPRVMQQVDDGDFQIGAGFLTEPNTTFQEHGLLVVEDAQNFIRFDTAYTSNGILRIIVGVIEDGNTNYPVFSGIAPGSVKDFRITRTGDDWLFETSPDGQTWVTVHTMTHSLAVAEVGVFAGSAEKNGVIPGYTAQVDYFVSADDPLLSEDGTLPPDPGNTAPVAADDAFVTDEDNPVAGSVTANDTDADSDPLTVTLGQDVANGSLTLNANGSFTYTPANGFTGTDTFTY